MTPVTGVKSTVTLVRCARLAPSLLATSLARDRPPRPVRRPPRPRPARQIALRRVGQRRRAPRGQPAAAPRSAAGGSSSPTRPPAPGPSPAARYETGRWTSPWAAPGFGLTELIPSWDAHDARQQPGRGLRPRPHRPAAGRAGTSSAAGPSGDRHVRRTLGRRPGRRPRPRQRRHLAVDAAAALTAYQVRVTLLRRAGRQACRRVDSVGAMASRLPDVGDVADLEAAAPGRGVAARRCRATRRWSTAATTRSTAAAARRGARRPRPRWCSATTTRCRAPAAYSWVPDGHADPWVDHAARMTYDHALRRHRQLAVQHGVRRHPRPGTRSSPGCATCARPSCSSRPASRWSPRSRSARGELDGAPISSTDGHLLVIVGFTDDGDVVVNDPAARPEPRRAPHLRPRPVRGRLDRPQEGDRLRDHRRRPPAAEGGARELVNAQPG